MAYYICVDAGGSKCQAILFDENFRLLGEGIAGGVNTNTTTPEDCRKNVARCLELLFASCTPARVERAYITFVGPRNVFMEQLEQCVEIGEYRRLGEGETGIYAGSVRKSGLVALSGTGSDVFYVVDGKNIAMVGGWGPILGDDGSGSWIGQRAIRAVVRAHDGWDEHTALEELIANAWSLERGWDMVGLVYQSPSPFRKVASLAPIVCEAAATGDRVATGILAEAGRLLARQMVSLIRRNEIPRSLWHVTCCGSVWKGNPVMLRAFVDSLGSFGYPCEVERSRFEPILAGVAQLILESGAEPDSARSVMEERFAKYAIRI